MGNKNSLALIAYMCNTTNNHESCRDKESTARTDTIARRIDIYPMSHESGLISLNGDSMNHEESGIRKRVSECVYPADILSDPAIQACHGLTRGCWLQTLLVMWRDGSYSVENTIPAFARMWGITEAECEQVIAEMELQRPCDVTRDVTVCHGMSQKVTLMSRRLSRRMQTRINDAVRQARHREKSDCHGHVTEQNGLPSSSSSISSSISSSSLRENTDSSAPQAGTEQPAHKRIVFDGNVITGFNADDLQSLTTAYPACDIDSEIRKAGLWLQANPAKRKKNVYRFVVNWLARSQERGGSAKSNKAATTQNAPSLFALQKQIETWTQERRNLFRPGEPDSPRVKELNALIAKAKKQAEEGF